MEKPLLRGLCNDTLRLEVRRRGATTLDAAVYICKEFIQQKESCWIEGKRDEKKINTKMEIKISNNRHGNKKEVNSLQTEDDDGIHDNGEEEEEEAINAIPNQINKRPTMFKPRPDTSRITCFNCLDLCHYASDCPKRQTATKLVSQILKFLPAQERQMKKQQRFVKGNKVNNISEDEEDLIFEEVSEDESDGEINVLEESEAEDEEVNAFKTGKKPMVRFQKLSKPRPHSGKFNVNSIKNAFP